MNISIVIPTYKNKSQLLQNLRLNFGFFNGCEIIIVNDNPKESLITEFNKLSFLSFERAERVEKNIIKWFSTSSNSNILLIENSQNLGFAKSVNKAVKVATYKYVMLLNDDVLLLDDRFKKALDIFKKNPSLFALSFAQKEKDNSIIGKNILYWKKGLMFHAKAKDLKPGDNAWAEGGSCLIDRSKFLGLGGFDSIYTPFYWEDIDLSYRAWKKGYKICFEPSILVHHHHESTIGKHFSKKYINKIAYRNQIIFLWKNITDPQLLIQHVLFLPYNLLYYLGIGEKEFFLGFVEALKKLATVLNKRKKLNKFITSDKNIISLFSL